ncbi:(Fe-S)-binding protein [Lacrimispora saccharolytica]|uniref:Iron-sulfur binding reductase n=1 Tax=Lacrimispora saccharolytica (strain ATCC 35040 / DSM 2544 / NRCC 2533 / WM1) TaxID=610130 RepID=D9R7Q2_LACSW|nr:(Fe-S)-binding protein [Lacrimispora saccharolytica]ADL03781.1 iron-sulfur binding reductase [[Clostridium] saccharolyticum WM1]QRV18090.1 (Fe-S)-binding protein [Lacrimispora saccharolytica]
MKDKERIIDPDACVHCHLCRQHCLFLEKYKLDIGDKEKLEELSYHCFLCGKCSEVCPKGIDGREIILNMRKEQVKRNDGQLREKGYGLLVREKQNYLFQNYRNGTKKSVLFPGCNFPAFYPETTGYLMELFRDKAGAGTVFDCCGKPIAELGMEKKEEMILEQLERKLEEHGVEEVITLCPNCYSYLKPRLKGKVVGIYEKLRDLGIGRAIEKKITIFPPCPDRENKELLGTIQVFLKEEPDIISHVQCCGLGGCAGSKEKDLAKQMIRRIGPEKGETVYTYCASCSGNFVRKGYGDTKHILLELLERNEEPDTGGSMVNRIKLKYRRE